MSDDEMKPEYDFSRGERGKHYAGPGAMKRKYAIVIEKGKRNYSAYVLDLPGCVAAAKTLEGTKRLMAEAIEFHLEGMREDGDPIPEPTTQVDYAEVTEKRAALKVEKPKKAAKRAGKRPTPNGR